MTSLSFEKANIDDATIFAKIAKRAFDSDIYVGSKQKEGGPPGYDTSALYIKMINVSKAFYKIIIENKIIGGFFIFDVFDGSRSHCELGMIFIDPDYQRKGYGIKSMEYLFTNFSQINKWSVGTPGWNTRTIAFYQKCGFKIVKQNKNEVLFEKEKYENIKDR
jgi:GNAT superfamily N-acetyltransferase